MSFENLKRNRDQISKLVQAAESVGGGTTEKKSYDDERIWKPTVDKAGNGYAVIRFLPAAVKRLLDFSTKICYNTNIVITLKDNL